ncbi:hypothetical protein Xinn_02922 [Xenorhabdus innexi]|uniref:Uncharacterized protein n=1 Tax=Xenorhabdus innexi TaxID=290109 RepID=A0A2G0N944_9GAMM|nr:hypothetical protein Xinn_02922 [Xenorhabdus innexi]
MDEYQLYILLRIYFWIILSLFLFVLIPCWIYSTLMIFKENTIIKRVLYAVLSLFCFIISASIVFAGVAFPYIEFLI